MFYRSFKIRNFKGIKELTIDLGEPPRSRIISLVGLNESGKTTILEALSFFYDEITARDGGSLYATAIDDAHSLVPKRLRDNFNDSIEIIAVVQLVSQDKERLREVCAEEAYIVHDVGDTFTVECNYVFQNTKLEGSHRYWDINITGKRRNKRKAEQLSVHETAWRAVAQTLRETLPPIIYYPNFLFEIPDQIFLTQTANEVREQVFYRRLVQDILDSLQNDLEIETHLIKRAQSNTISDRESLQSVVNKMGSKITSLIFGPNISVFQENADRKTIVVSNPIYDDESSAYYLEIKLREGDDSYYIRERSLGFRWFFAFLMFTKFRSLRTGGGNKPLFLFDEPASNLHQTAQQKLLTAFEELVADSGTTVIYTTHSHHLIDPRWLESAYIVQNQGLQYDNDTSYNLTMTDVQVTRYREFVARHPDQRTYFQPILDVLEYRPSNLESISDVVMVEGKNDFYALSYLKDIFLEQKTTFRLLPGGGAGSLDSAIQLYYAWGREFIILVDSDEEGNKQKTRYMDKFGKILEGKIFTLGDALFEGAGRIENLFEEEDRSIIQSILISNTNTRKFQKKIFFLALQECLITKRKLSLSNETKQRSSSLFSFLDSLFQKEPTK